MKIYKKIVKRTLKNNSATIVIIILFILSVFITTTVLSQPILDTTRIETTLKPAIIVQKTEITLEDSGVIDSTHKETIKQMVSKTELGRIVWSYFGEIIIGGLSLFVIWIRKTIKHYFSILLNRIKRLEISATISHDNFNLKEIASLNDGVDDYLTEIKTLTKSKRVLLYQFSNGQHFFSNQPVLRITATNSSDGNPITQAKNYFNYTTSKQIIHEILNNEYIVCDDQISTKYSGYTAYLKYSKFKNATLVRLDVGDNYSGVIEIIEPSTETDYNKVKAYCLSIGHLFDRYNDNRLKQIESRKVEEGEKTK